MSQPRNIEVFDGLRITTEHLEHLQGSIHSAIGDVRAILGLGRVYRGFGVAPAADGAITVQPGLAFDLEERRVVSDAPVTVTIPPVTGQSAQYVCVQYAQTSDGVVEGRPTMIFDSCEVVVRPSAPRAPDPAIAVARLTAPPPTNGATAAGGFDVQSLLTTATHADPAPAPTLRVRQGVESLESAPDTPTALGDLLLAATERPAPEPFLATLLEREVDVGFPLATVATRALVTLTVRSTPVVGDAAPATQPEDTAATTGTTTDTAATPPPPPPPPPPEGDVGIVAEERWEMRVEGVAAGDATAQADTIAQSGLTTATLLGSGATVSPSRAVLTERGVAEVVIAAGGPAAPLNDIRLVVTVAARGDVGFTLACRLATNRAPPPDFAAWLRARRLVLEWRATVAWKALGMAGVAASTPPPLVPPPNNP